MNLLHSSSSAGNLGPSYNKVNMASYANPHITLGISRIYHSLNHLNIESWIMDFGESGHICSLIKFFNSYQNTIPVNIRLPNRHTEIERYSRTLTFSPDFIAQDVLFMPEFSMNVLQVPKLCFDLDYIVIFNNAKCLIQKKRRYKMFSLTDLFERLYYLATT